MIIQGWSSDAESILNFIIGIVYTVGFSFDTLHKTW